MMRIIFPSLALMALLSGTALAQDAVIEHYDEDTGAIVTDPAELPAAVEEEDGPVIVESPADPAAHYEPPVYGWVMVAPGNCGTFKYWNGERCADARYDPPGD